MQTNSKKNEIKPWKVKEWIIPTASPDFVCAMENVLEIYERPYDSRFPVVCLDESPKQLFSETREPYQKNGVDFIDYEYKREGVADIYMLVEPKGGHREVFISNNHNHFSYGKMLLQIANKMYPCAERITLINDNLSAHKASSLYELLPAEEARAMLKRFEFVNTPKHGSWLNIAECELSVLTRQGLSRRICKKEELQTQATAWSDERNNKQIGVNWQFTSKDARIKLKRLYPIIIT